MKTTLKLSIVFITFLVSNSKIEEFCQSFANNGFKVDFAFQNITNMSSYIWSLHIGPKYWLIERNTLDLKLVSKESNSFDFSGSVYRLAFNFKDLNSDSIVGLLRKNESLIDWKRSSSLDKIASTLMNFTGFDPSFSFPILNKSQPCFCEQKPISGESKKYKLRNECFQFSTHQSQIIVNYLNNYSLNLELNDIIGKNRIVGMFSPETNTNGFQYTLVYDIGRALNYCIIEKDRHKLKCKDSNLLINCTATTVGATVSTTVDTSSSLYRTSLRPKTPTDNNYLKWIVVSVVVIVVILVIVVIILCLIKSKKTTKVNQKKSSEENKPPKDNSNGDKPTSLPKQTKDPSNPNKKKTKKLSPAKKARQQLETKGSEAFIVQKDVDYSKPIPLNQNKNVGNDSSTESFRPTDLNVKPN